jgi:hypothetical protein
VPNHLSHLIQSHTFVSLIQPNQQRVLAGLSQYDVIEGRGTAANEHVGNIRFRRKIAKHYHAYSKLKDGQKHTLAAAIVAEVYAEGGRFMKKVSDGNGKSNSKTKKNKKGSGGVGGVWVEVSHERAKKKAQTLLRDYTLKGKRQATAAQRNVCASPIPSMTEAAASPVPQAVTPERLVTPVQPVKVPSFLALPGPVWTSFPALPLVEPSSSFSEDPSAVEDEDDGSWSTSSLDSRPTAFLTPRASSYPLLAFWSATTTTSATIAVGTPTPPPCNIIMAPPPLGLPQEEIDTLFYTLDGDGAIDVERILDQDPGMFDDFDEFFSAAPWE